MLSEPYTRKVAVMKDFQKYGFTYFKKIYLILFEKLICQERRRDSDKKNEKERESCINWFIPSMAAMTTTRQV